MRVYKELSFVADKLSFDTLFSEINSFISGEVVTEDGIDSTKYNLCQTRLVAMQDSRFC